MHFPYFLQQKFKSKFQVKFEFTKQILVWDRKLLRQEVPC